MEINLIVGRTPSAAILQPVASAAWALVADPTATSDLQEAARKGLATLSMMCGMLMERRFLQAVMAFAAGHPSRVRAGGSGWS